MNNQDPCNPVHAHPAFGDRQPMPSMGSRQWVTATFVIKLTVDAIFVRGRQQSKKRPILSGIDQS